MTCIQVDMTFGTCAVYLVDVMQSRSSEILAAIKFVHFSRLDFNELFWLA